jgi:hypothetical protein
MNGAVHLQMNMALHLQMTHFALGPCMLLLVSFALVRTACVIVTTWGWFTVSTLLAVNLCCQLVLSICAALLCTEGGGTHTCQGDNSAEVQLNAGFMQAPQIPVCEHHLVLGGFH